jgi:hypothetical protein
MSSSSSKTVVKSPKRAVQAPKNPQPPKNPNKVPITRVGLLTQDKNKKSGSAPAPRVGFVGGLNKLREIQNNIPVSDGEKPQPKIVRAARNKDTYNKIEQPVLVKDIDESSYEEIEDEDSSVLETIDSENEDMARFCKRMCKKTNLAMEENQQRQKDMEKINFRKARKRYVHSKMEHFRTLVKEHVQQGKMLLFEYKKNDAFDGYLIYKLLTELTDDVSGLKMLSEMVDPFRMFHYSEGDKWSVEITWAVPSLKNVKMKPNKLPEKVKRRVRKVRSNPEDTPSSLTMADPTTAKIRAKNPKNDRETDVIVAKQKFAKSQK